MSVHYTVEKVGVVDGVPTVWIVDDCDKLAGARSITNAAELVCMTVNRYYPRHRIIYLDTMDNWDELVHGDGVFKAFAPARHLAL